MKLRILDIGPTSPLRSQAVYHGIAENLTIDDDPVLILTTPRECYISIGMHQDAGQELDLDYCRQQSLKIIRRQVGGGTVLLDSQQLFFHFVFPRHIAPKTVETLYPFFIKPVVMTYQTLGIPARFRPDNDIQVDNRRIGGTGAASIGQATVMVGSFLFDFDHALMARIIRAPSERFREKFAQLLPQYLTTIKRETQNIPTHDELKSVFLQQLEACLGLRPEDSTISHHEERAINGAARELEDPEWLMLPGRKSVANGIKLCANSYLTETQAVISGEPVRSLLFQQENIIRELALSGDLPGLASLSAGLTGIPLTADALQRATADRDDSFDTESLCRLILQGAQRDPV